MELILIDAAIAHGLTFFEGGIIGPLIVYVIKKDSSPFVAFHALQSLYFVAVGGECFEKGYNYYAKLVFMTTWPLGAT